MKFLDEYRDGDLAQKLAAEIHHITTKPWTIMEVCGGQTHAIVKFGIDELLPKQITLIHGPGCPVCVTPLEMIDKALEIAARPKVIFTSFGDMLRVPGSTTDLLAVKGQGGDVRIVYSPLDAVKIAEENPAREVVFFGVGFETTAPATAMAIFQAAQKKLKNFSMLISHVLVLPVMEALLASPIAGCRRISPPAMFAR
jgi:hydrogenase expression/formation protein HypD